MNINKEMNEKDNVMNVGAGEGEGEVKEDGDGTDKENRFSPVRAGDLIRALECVTAAVFRCSHVKAFLVSSDVIEASRGDLLFLSNTSSSPPTPVTRNPSRLNTVRERVREIFLLVIYLNQQQIVNSFCSIVLFIVTIDITNCLILFCCFIKS